MFQDLYNDAIDRQVRGDGHFMLLFRDGVVCDCVRSHPRNANQWTIVSSHPRKLAKQPLTVEQRSEARALRRSLADGRREFRNRITAINKEGDRLWRDKQKLERDLADFEKDLNRRITRIECQS
jgi:hypothetical protein